MTELHKTNPLVSQFTAGKKINMLFASSGSFCIVKNCGQGLENAVEVAGQGQHFSRPQSQFFTTWTSQLANNIIILFIIIHQIFLLMCDRPKRVT